MNFSKAQLAKAANCSEPLITAYFGKFDNVRAEIMATAVKVECLPIIAQGLGAADPIAEAADDDLKTRAALSLAPAK